jgi:hypothetical protein
MEYSISAYNQCTCSCAHPNPNVYMKRKSTRQPYSIGISIVRVFELHEKCIIELVDPTVLPGISENNLNQIANKYSVRNINVICILGVSKIWMEVDPNCRFQQKLSRI